MDTYEYVSHDVGSTVSNKEKYRIQVWIEWLCRGQRYQNTYPNKNLSFQRKNTPKQELSIRVRIRVCYLGFIHSGYTTRMLQPI